MLTHERRDELAFSVK